MAIFTKSATTSQARNRNIRRLEKLSPTEFENLIFDLTVLRGATNVNWRTPGADGGRDIEASVAYRDFSGAQLTQKWFIECKRYAVASIDWPTIYQKVAYADSLQAEVLLMCTTSKFSVPAVTQVEAWNSSRRSPVIRLWPRHEIDLQLKSCPDLLVKYGLSSVPTMPGKSIVALALALSKSVSSHYSRLVFGGMETDRMVEAAQALAEFLSQRMEELERSGQIQPPSRFSLAASLGAFASSDGFVKIDEAGLRAFVKYLAALAPQGIKVNPGSATSCYVSSATAIGPIIRRYLPVFSAIALWSNFAFVVANKRIEIKQMEGP